MPLSGVGCVVFISLSRVKVVCTVFSDQEDQHGQYSFPHFLLEASSLPCTMGHGCLCTLIAAISLSLRLRQLSVLSTLQNHSNFHVYIIGTMLFWDDT